MSGAVSQKRAMALGIPDGFKMFSAYPMGGMNFSAARTALDDKDFYWVEGLFRAGDGKYRALWDVGGSIYTAPPGTTIVYWFFFNIGPSYYFAIFLSDGTAVQVNWPDGSGARSISGVAGTFYKSSTGQLPACQKSGGQYLLISNNNTPNDYWIWDGESLYASGTIAPTQTGALTSGGSGYSSLPTLTVFGGHGAGVGLAPVIANGSVVAINVFDPGSGYQAGDVLVVGFTGGGSDTTPVLQAVLGVGAIGSVTISNGGTGWLAGNWQFPLTFTGGAGSGAAGTFTVAGGVVTGANITTGGSGYTYPGPTVGFSIPGSGAVFGSNIVSNKIANIPIFAAGSGYVPGNYPLSFVGGGGNGAAATAIVDQTGTVVSVDLTNGGVGFTSSPIITMPTGGTGTVGVPILTSAVVSAVSVLNGGTNLIGTPTLSFAGGGGSGAIATALVEGGSIVSVSVTSGGLNYSSAPAVIVETSTNNAAYATLEVMPFGISGSSIETYQQRAWLPHPYQGGTTPTGGTFLVSAPGSLTDFATSSGGDIFTNTDRFLAAQFIALRQTGNFLYAIGDSSVSVISNVQTAGNPPSTTFSFQNSDPQTGSPWRDTLQDFGNTILFANQIGVWGVYGGSVRRVSEQLDDLFFSASALLTPSTPMSSAITNLFGKKVYLLLTPIVDPFSGLQRTVLLGWDDKRWFVASQSKAMTFIGTVEVSSQIAAWGTDGTDLFPLLTTPAATTKKLVTKLYGAPQPYMIKKSHSIYIEAEDLSASQSGVSFLAESTVDATGIAVPVVNSVTSATQSSPSVSVPFGGAKNMVAPQGLGAVYATWGLDVYGIAIGATLVTQSTDFVINNVSIGYLEYAALA